MINIMEIDLPTFFLFARELSGILPGARLQKIFQPQKEQFVLKFRLAGENFFLYFSLEPGHQKVHPIPDKLSRSIPPTSFCMMLRKHLMGGILDRVEVMEHDRILPLIFEVKRGEQLLEKTLCLEFAGSNCNSIIIDSGGRYVGAFTRKDPNREIITGQPYAPPPPPGPGPFSITRDHWIQILKESPTGDASRQMFPGFPRLWAREVLQSAGLSPRQLNEDIKDTQIEALWNCWEKFTGRLREGLIEPVLYYDSGDPSMEGQPTGWAPWPFACAKDSPRRSFETVTGMLQEYFLPRVSMGRFDEVQSRLLSELKKKLSKVHRRIEKQKGDLEGAMQAERLKKFGELLLSSLHRIEGKARQVTVEDYYQDPPAPITIKLNPSLSPSDNAQDYFRRYKKALRGQEKIRERLEISQNEARELESRINMVGKALNNEEIEELLKSFAVDSFYPSGKLPRKADGQPVSRPKAFELARGYVALVGRNSRENDEITLKVGKKEDLWFHARQIPGSHVVLKVQKPSHTIPSQVLYRAAQLAAYYSKASSSQSVPVDYTKIKYVRKAKGAKLGEVLYSGEKTIMAQPRLDPDQIRPKEDI